ncbi:MAG: HAMP domain-containing sensor histidine kinase [Chloroflexi bacterium]|nr:HAMP domain-containing sensor histidine kinase [Chloroflexota bacterium]
MSLRWRIFWLLIPIIVLTASISLALSYFAAQRQFNAFVRELSRREADSLGARLSTAYTASMSWETLDRALAEAGYDYEYEADDHEEGEDGSEAEASEDFHIDRIRVVITDMDGRVIADNFAELAAGNLLPSQAGKRREIRDLRKNIVVGFAYVDVHQSFLETESLGFVQDLLASSAIGGVLIVAFAAALAVSLSKVITAPVTALTKAAQAIAQQESATLLPVVSSDELGKMSAAFNQMTSALQRQRDLRKRLINDISHELNTPLAVIQLEAKALLDELQSPKQAAQHISQEVTMLRNLTNDLNWLAETDSGEWRLNRELCAINELLASEVTRWQPQAQSRQISLSLHPLPNLPALMLDAPRMRQALGNLIHNALLHGDAPRVVVSAIVTDDEAVEISVADDGTGIAAQELSQVFQRGFRSEQAHGSGRGFGLNIAQTIIEAHGGSLAAKTSNDKSGTTIKIRLPMPSADAGAQKQR